MRFRGPAIALQVGGPILTLVAVVACDIATRHGVGLPVPMVVLLAAVVISGVVGGLRPAITSAVFVLLYSLHFFSIPGSPLRYTGAGLWQLGLVFLTVPLAALPVGALRQRELDRATGGDAPAPPPPEDRVDLPQGSVGTVASAAARHAANTLADWATVRVLDGLGGLRCVAAAHRLAVRDPVARQLVGRGAREASGRVTAAGVWGGASPCLLDVSAAMLGELADGEERAAYDALAPARILTVPLRARGRALGILELGAADGSALGEPAIPAAQRLADRLAAALDAATAAAQAEEAERRYRMLFESHPNPMWIFDTETLTFLDVNDAAVRHYGYSRAEFLAMTIMEVLPDDDAPAPVRSAERRVSQREGVALARHQKRDGSLLDVEIVSHALTFAGRPARIVLVTDVSDRTRVRVALHERDEQLRRAQRLDAAARLASGVAHDFNNVLTASHGYSDLLLREFDDGDPRASDVQEIRRAADRGALLTRQLLAFGHRPSSRPESLDLNGVVRGLESLLQRLVGADVQLETVLAPDIGRIRADPGHIEQVVINLVLNARDALGAGGTLTIETSERHMAPSSRAPGSRAGLFVVLAVTDSGSGMDEETKARLFEPLLTTKEPAHGTGLGLAIVHGIVKSSGGTIRVSSEPGAGTSVRLFFPRVEEAETALPPEEPGGGAETILLVEDEEPVRAVIRKMLTANGYAVLEARHGRDALLVAERHRGPIQLLVTDVVMPEMGGRELAERLRARHPGLRVLYISGYTSDEVVRKGVDGSAFVAKPFTSDVLLRSVRATLAEPAPSPAPVAAGETA
jgi:PAS domain S-box-containing protein